MKGADKSHVGMETRACVVCGVEYETGAILLDRRMRQSLARRNCTGWGMCEEHERLYKDGYVALVGVDAMKSDRSPEGNIHPSGAHRTGEIVHIRLVSFSRIFNIPPPKGGVVFVDPMVIEKMRELQSRAESGEEGDRR